MDRNEVQGQKGCFPGNTTVLMGDGTNKPISQVKKGDKIISFNETGELYYDTVEEVFVHKGETISRFYFWSGTIEATPSHWVVNQFGTFAEIGALECDDAVVDANGHLRPFKFAEKVKGLHTVYNLKVTKRATFIAGGIRVHNGAKGRTTVENFIAGDKGGDKGGGGAAGRAAVEAPNTLKSKAIVKTVDVIAEGEIVGLADGAKSIFFDETPVQNEDDTFNFGSLEWEERVGLPATSQTALAGFPDTENTVSIGIPVTVAIGPAVRAITDIAKDAIRVNLRLPSGLSLQDKKTSDLNGTSVTLAIDTRPVSGSGAWTEIRSPTITGKTVTPYEVSYRIEKPVAATGAWDVRVRRVTDDSTTSVQRDSLVWGSITEIVDLRMVYSDTAVVGLSVDSELVGNRIPARGYEIFGSIIQIPSNYTPRQYDKDGNITAEPVYAGIWDGTFTAAWTNNPAWVYYDMLTNARYGLGLEAASVDKFSLYTISQYCDELVDDGFGSQEPRFAFTGILNSREEAFNVLQAIASVFRGMAYWSSGAVGATQDSPKDASKLYTQANVIEGIFNYDSTSLKSRHSVCAVTWSDPNDGYRAGIELVEDTELISQFGYVQKDILAYGCTSQGQANRFGKWVLDSERYETETVNFQTSWDSADVLPGDVIAIADDFYSGVRTGGKLVSGTLTSLTLDNPIELEAGETYTVQFVCANGTVHPEVDVTNTVPGTYTVLDLDIPLSEVPRPNAVYIVIATNLEPREFRVIVNRELEDGVFEIVALLYDATKYVRVETGVQLELPDTSKFDEFVITPVQNIESNLELHTLPEGLRWRLHVQWEPPAIGFAKKYVLTYRKDNGDFIEIPRSYGPDAYIEDIVPGTYEIVVQAENLLGLLSLPVTHTKVITDEAFTPLGQISGLQVEKQGNDTEFAGRSVTIKWRQNHPTASYPLGERYGADGGYLPDTFGGYQIEVYDENDVLLRREFEESERYLYSFEDNTEDGGPRRNLTFKVQWREKTSRLSKGKLISVTNSAPEEIPLDQITTESAQSSFIITIPRPTDPDFFATSVWISTTPGFTPTNQELVYKGTDQRITISQLNENTTYYVRLMKHDEFDPDGGNLSDELTVSTLTTLASFKASSAGTTVFTFSELVDFSTADPAGLVIGNIISGRPISAKVFVSDVWDTAATLSIGFKGKNGNGVMTIAQNDLTVVDSYQSTSTIFNNIGGDVAVFINNNGSPTTGQAFVVVEYVITE